MEKRRNCSLGAISPLFHNIFHLMLDFHVSAGTRFSLRDKWLFEISEFEITRVNCSYIAMLRNNQKKSCRRSRERRTNLKNNIWNSINDNGYIVPVLPTKRKQV